MTIYAIGDVQGCHDELVGALAKVGFTPARDRLWFVGDLVNRGPQSLAVLRFVRGLGDAAICVLGNHDLHLLALGAGNDRKDAADASLREILQAPDRDELLDWLRERPLMHQDPATGYVLLHAGLPPEWDIATAAALAREVENVLRGPDRHAFLMHMYGNNPKRWSPKLKGMDRLRFITNCFTRLRYCASDGTLALKEKGPPGSQQPKFRPWFEHPHRASRDHRILCGHWSTLGYHAGNNVWALDTGCLWGGALTLLQIDTGQDPKPIPIPCPGRQDPRRFA